MTSLILAVLSTVAQPEPEFCSVLSGNLSKAALQIWLLIRLVSVKTLQALCVACKCLLLRMCVVDSTPVVQSKYEECLPLCMYSVVDVILG